ncbi:uncharacterized protein VTP21DRAFT_6778 [Calcarisporiella thermophila]|uniref:uncharacterized protein n=1 Tax=Calcarisporiella thermophila TaxID=911321 RepID=UPI003743605B
MSAAKNNIPPLRLEVCSSAMVSPDTAAKLLDKFLRSPEAQSLASNTASELLTVKHALCGEDPSESADEKDSEGETDKEIVKKKQLSQELSSDSS